MADIFISYKREDRERIAPLARALEARGYTVWWDLELVPSQKFERQIFRELDAAKCVIVVWTARSIDDMGLYASDWINTEANAGDTRGILLPVQLDAERTHRRHSDRQFANLVGWTGDESAPGFQDLLKGVELHVGARARPQDVELSAWQSAERAETAEGFKRFLDSHPQSRFADIARGRIAELEEVAAWQALGAAPTIAALAAFLRRFPTGRFADDAEAKIRAMELASAREAAPSREPQAAAQPPPRLEPATAEPRSPAAGWPKWLAPAGAAGVALLALLVWSPWNRASLPEAETPAVVAEAPAAAPDASGAAPPAASPAPAASFVDARTTPSSTRAPLVTNPASLPDFALFRECEGCPEMVVIPAGTFLMGSPASEPGRKTDEGPQVSVRVPRFAISRFETTWDEWAACVSAGVCQQREDQGFGRGRRPVINVDWQTDTRAFIRFLNGRASGYRLPSEAEWEYAARAGTTTAFFWGASAENHCDYTASVSIEYWDEQQGDSIRPSCGAGEVGPVSAGRFAPNRFGLFDMVGNVSEWVEDCYRSNLTGQRASAFVATPCPQRVFRGGAWYFVPDLLRSSSRSDDNPDFSADFLGFRLARDLVG
jgi:formylglycine-generating enzyme required for sulfatase activity